MLTPTELAYWGEKYKRGPNPQASVDYAHAQAIEYVRQHAEGMLPVIQHGIALNCFRYMLEGDPGERNLLRVAIDCLVRMGRACHANAAAD